MSKFMIYIHQDVTGICSPNQVMPNYPQSHYQIDSNMKISKSLNMTQYYYIVLPEETYGGMAMTPGVQVIAGKDGRLAPFLPQLNIAMGVRSKYDLLFQLNLLYIPYFCSYSFKMTHIFIPFSFGVANFSIQVTPLFRRLLTPIAIFNWGKNGANLPSFPAMTWTPGVIAMPPYVSSGRTGCPVQTH